MPITSPYLESMSNRVTAWERAMRSATHCRGTMTRKPPDTASTTAARTQLLVEFPVTIAVSTPARRPRPPVQRERERAMVKVDLFLMQDIPYPRYIEMAKLAEDAGCENLWLI